LALTQKSRNSVELKIVNPFTKVSKPSFIKRISYWFNWLITKPIHDIKENGIRFSQNSSIFRLLFASYAAILLILMLTFSFDAGNSGDEITLIRQAEKTYNFFATKGKDRSAIEKQGRDPMYAYGQSFDLVTYAIAKWFNIDDLYALRHFVNTLLGWMAMLFTALLALWFLGWRASFLALLLISLSPRFLGHSWNNPKDIPFALGFIFTLYFAFHFIKHLPKFSLRNIIYLALGFAFTNSIRIGGLLLVAYLGLFVAFKLISIYGLKGLLQKKLQYTVDLAARILLVLFAGYLLGIVLWPFALLNPIKNPLEALDLMTNFKISLRQLFEGEIIWSDNLPWYYALKYMLYTIPLFIFAGILFAFASIRKIIETSGSLNLFLLSFIWLFPILYTIYQDSNLYGGWRHLMFSYPPLVVLAASGFDRMYTVFKSKYVSYAITLVLVVLLIKPTIHTFKNHPYQYVYYNEIAGGVENVWGEYELDYYFHSFKTAADWLLENELKDQFSTEKKILIKTNAGAKDHFREYEDYVHVSYMKYYERGNHDWDYALIVNTYIQPKQLKRNLWPPSNTIHTIDVDGVPICAIIKRKTKLDYKASLAYKAKDYETAINLYNQALEITPDNELAYLNLAQIYHSTGNYPEAINAANKCLEFYPDYDRALTQLGVSKLAMNKLNDAASAFTKVIKLNKKYGPAYYYMGIIYQMSGDVNGAQRYAQKAIEATPNFKPAYIFMANLLQAQGLTKEAQRFMNAANSIK
jgi:Tfp pilus assembly protein PilF